MHLIVQYPTKLNHSNAVHLLCDYAKNFKSRMVKITNPFRSLVKHSKKTLWSFSRFFLLGQKKVITAVVHELPTLLNPVVLLEYHAWLSGQPIDPQVYLADFACSVEESISHRNLNSVSSYTKKFVVRQRTGFLLGTFMKAYRP